MMKRAVLYMRVSRVDQHPEAQVHDLRAMAAQPEDWIRIAAALLALAFEAGYGLSGGLSAWAIWRLA
jgi:hypothetical protein